MSTPGRAARQVYRADMTYELCNVVWENAKQSALDDTHEDGCTFYSWYKSLQPARGHHNGKPVWEEARGVRVSTGVSPQCHNVGVPSQQIPPFPQLEPYLNHLFLGHIAWYARNDIKFSKQVRSYRTGHLHCTLQYSIVGLLYVFLWFSTTFASIVQCSQSRLASVILYDREECMQSSAPKNDAEFLQALSHDLLPAAALAASTSSSPH